MFRSRSLRDKDGIKDLKGGAEAESPRSSPTPRWAFPGLAGRSEAKSASRGPLRALRRGAAVGASDAGKENNSTASLDPPSKPGVAAPAASGPTKAAPQSASQAVAKTATDAPGTPQAAPYRQPIMRSRTSDSASELGLTSGGEPVGWPLKESTLRLSTIQVPSVGLSGASSGGEGASSVPASPARSVNPATPRRVPSVFATEAALTAELKAKEGELLAKEGELRAHRVKQAEAEAAAKAMEAQWKAEVAAAAAQMAEMRRAKEALEVQLEIAAKEIEQSSGKGPAKRARAGPSFTSHSSSSSSSPSPASSSSSSSASGSGSDAANGSGSVTVRPGGRLGTVLEDGAIEEESEDDFQWMGSDPSPSQQLGRLKLENVVLKEHVAGLEAEKASLEEQVASLSRRAAEAAEKEEAKSQLLAAEAKIGELERKNAELLLLVSNLRSETSFLYITKSGASYDLFCAS